MRLLWFIGILLLLQVGGSLSAQEKKEAKPDTTIVKKKEVSDPVKITTDGKIIKVSNVKVGSKLEIYSVVGIRVREIEMKQTSGEYPVNIAKGYYIVRIGETVRKIAIK